MVFIIKPNPLYVSSTPASSMKFAEQTEWKCVPISVQEYNKPETMGKERTPANSTSPQLEAFFNLRANPQKVK